MLSREATNTSITVFELTLPMLEPTIYHTPGEHPNHYASNVVFIPYRVRGRVMVFNTTSNNISVISWRSDLLVEETGVPGENH